MKYQEYFLPGSIVLAAALIAGAWVYTTRLETGGNRAGSQPVAASSQPPEDTTALAAEVWPTPEVVLPVKWGSLGKQLVASGVIDKAKFEEIYKDRGGLTEAERALLDGSDNGELKINQQ